MKYSTQIHVLYLAVSCTSKNTNVFWIAPVCREHVDVPLARRGRTCLGDPEPGRLHIQSQPITSTFRSCVATAPAASRDRPCRPPNWYRKRERRVRAAIVSLHTSTHDADAAAIAASRAPEKAASISAILGLRRKSWNRSYYRIIGPGILPGRGAAAQAAGPGRPGASEFLRPSLHASRRPRTSGPPPPERASPPPCSDREVES
jgi:hypothetical protein